MAGDVARAVDQCDERDSRLPLASFHLLGCSGRCNLGGFVRYVGLHLQRSCSSNCGCLRLSRLGHPRTHCLSSPRLENSALPALAISLEILVTTHQGLSLIHISEP